MLFANGAIDSIVILVLIVLGLKCAYRAYLFVYRPAQYAEEVRMRHEQKMAAAERRKAAAGRISGNVLGAIIKSLLGVFLKK